MRRLGLIGLAGLLAGAAAPADKPVRQFHDWLAACDNTRSCAAFGFAGEDAPGLFLHLRRGGDAAAEPVVEIGRSFGADEAPSAVTLTVEGGKAPAHFGPFRAGKPEGGIPIPPAAARALIPALRDGKTLTIHAGKDRTVLPLAGAAAALRWIDDRQGRAGTATALAAVGPKPASGPPIALPLVQASPQLATEAKLAPSKALLSRPELKDCDQEVLANAEYRGSWRLGPDTVLWSLGCEMGAYNLVSRLFLTDGKGGAVRPARLPPVPGSENDDPDRLVNDEFDPKTKVLAAFDTGRGIGDCGESARYVWTGRGFALLQAQEMPVCRGVDPDSWPYTYRARLK